MSNSTEYEEASIVDPTLAWGNVQTAVSIILGISLPTIFWLHRHHPLIAIRIPSVVITELVLDMALLFVIATQYGDAFAMWAPSPCALQNSFSASFNFILFNVSMARVVLFYRLAQVNIMQHSEENFRDKAVHYLGLLCAPREFQRLELKLKYLAQTNISTITMDSDQVTVQTDRLEATESLKRREFVLWLGKLLSWFLF